MIEKMIIILEIFTYFAIFPIIFNSLASIDFSKIFKKHHVYDIRIIYFFVSLALTKLVGDFITNIMRLLLALFGVIDY